MGAPADLAQARAEAAAARARLSRSAHTLQVRLSPAELAGNALAGARERGAAALGDATEVARRRPWLAGAVAAGAAVLLLRRPLRRLFRRPTHVHLPSPRRALPRPTGDQP